MSHSKALNKLRATTGYDINKINNVGELIESNQNPLYCSIISYQIETKFTAKDIFTYYKIKNKEFDIIVSGGK